MKDVKNVEEQKKKILQKKNRLAAEETKLRLKERKLRTRHLIENGGLIVKAELDKLPTNALYGALLSLKEELDNNSKIMAAWVVKGDKAFNAEQKQNTPIILTFDEQPEKEIRDQIRSLGLRWNKFRSEWYGTVSDMDILTKLLKNQTHNIEVLNTN